MRPAHVIEIKTPKKFLLNGLWFGPLDKARGKPTKPKRAIIWVHGLASSAFSKLGLVERLVDKDTAVITFNNRGSSTVTRTRKINPRKKGGMEYVVSGGAHEVFTECVDDIQGAIDFTKKQGAKEIFLAGHSTGAQKSVYFASRKGNEKKIKGVILLAPLSDYAGALKEGKAPLTKMTAAAQKLVRNGKKHAIVPGSWTDAQRFLSLYTPDSTEEIFSYIDPDTKPTIYESLKVPTLVLLAEDDEHADRDAERIEAWFAKHARMPRFGSAIIADADHGFTGAEKTVAGAIKDWISA
ncbi:MAG: alpha/beta fold hydrolase [Minisyncoccia bacterium]